MNKNTVKQEPRTSSALLHTKGPWAVYEHSDHSGICIGPPYSDSWMKGKGDPGFRTLDVCTISGMGRRHVTPEEKANARLIAAAPDLLEACKAVEGAKKALESLGYRVNDNAEHKQMLNAYLQVDAAIAAATKE